ncbi:tyrosine--tRNA ligase [Candidatus Kaiserbacteria bacterium]|nr:tyrosine--tRNA ligase [Candidatus Kaiserbacteria bacterium]
MQKLSDTLRERGYVYQYSSETLEEITDPVSGQKRTVYLGIDPSADSFHIGNLQALLVLRRFLEAGHKVILLVGGGTGMIGDPSGKSEERNLLDDATVTHNTAALRVQAEYLFGGLDFQIVNNADWLGSLDLIGFLRDIGKHFSVNAMLQRDSVKNRIQNQEEGISYTEFSYMLLQSYDFLHLHQEYGCDLQIGASDQWGNMVSGIDLIRRKTGDTTYAFSCPLLINKSTGKKFGKSEGGAVWLDSAKTSPFEFYQFWFNTDDESVEEFLFKMTMLSKPEIDAVMSEHSADPSHRIAQKKLAFEVTQLVHGEEIARGCEMTPEILYSKDIVDITETDADILRAIKAPMLKVAAGDTIIDALVGSLIASSKREARQFIEDGAVSLNGARVSDAAHTIAESDFHNGLALLKRGKRAVVVLMRI